MMGLLQYTFHHDSIILKKKQTAKTFVFTVCFKGMRLAITE